MKVHRPRTLEYVRYVGWEYSAAFYLSTHLCVEVPVFKPIVRHACLLARHPMTDHALLLFPFNKNINQPTFPIYTKFAHFYFKTFDKMEEELRMARERRAHRQRNFYSRSHVGENVVAVKRQTEENNWDYDGKCHAYSKWTCIDISDRLLACNLNHVQYFLVYFLNEIGSEIGHFCIDEYGVDTK